MAPCVDDDPVRDGAERDRAVGALLGVHCGDSLGATLEFMSPAACREAYPDGLRDIVGGGAFGWPVGAPTDDTELTVALARGYLDARFGPTDDVARAAAARMGEWYARGPRDVGGATAEALGRYRATGDHTTSGAVGDLRRANGSLMRTMPVAIARIDAAELRAVEADVMSAITHAEPMCRAACIAYCHLAAHLVHGAEPRSAVRAVLDDRAACAHGVGPAVREAAMAPSFDHLTGPQGGYVLWSLKVAVNALVRAVDLEEALVETVMLGGDTDTNGAIAGGLLGARFGAAALPHRWVERLHERAALEGFAHAALEAQAR